MSTLPLEKRKISLDVQNGLNKEVPAIHEVWKEHREWNRYVPPPSILEMELTGAIDAWLNTANRVGEDLTFLLRLPAHKFWSQILFDERLQIILECMLQNYPRAYDQPSNKQLLDANLRVLHKLFLVYLRLSTYKESQSDYFSPEYYANLIYDKYIIDIPKLLDICSLFPDCNKEITKKMVANVFKVQPKYSDDLYSVGETLTRGFETVAEQLQVVRMSQRNESTSQEIVDILGFILDIASSIDCMLEVYPPAVHALHPTGFETKLASFYHTSMVELSELIDKCIEAKLISQEESIQYTKLLQLARHRTITSFRQMVNVLCLQPLLPPSDQDNGSNQDCDIIIIVEEYLAMFTNILQERSFLLDYNTRYSIVEDLEMLEQVDGSYIDPTRKHYILDALCCDTKQDSVFSAVTERVEHEEQLRGAVAAVPAATTSSTSNGTEEVLHNHTDIEVQSMITSVQDLLPHLGPGFVEECLLYYKFKVEEVVNAILEGNLPPHLADMDQSLQRQPKPVPQHLQAVPDIQGRSIYDDDEFDINSRDSVDISNIHRGKKNKVGTMKDLFNNKQELDSMRERFSMLGIVEDLETMRGEERDYDDEYDDTYDDLAVGQQEPDSSEMEAGGRKFVLPVALGGGKIHLGSGGNRDASEEETSDEDENCQYGGGKKPMNFARNPEEVRQEAERRRQEKMQRRNRHKGGGGGGGGGGPPAAGGNGGGGGGGTGAVPPHRDVVGRAKGQGQDKQVLLNRARKNANKGKGHRIGADKKMSKGMF